MMNIIITNKYMKLIDKDKVISEINRRINVEIDITKKFSHPFYASEITRCNARIALLEQFRDFLNTLEIKEVKPVEQEDEEYKEFLDDLSNDFHI